MRALQVLEFATPIVDRDLPDPQPQAGEVIVEVASCGVCHTETHLHQGHISLGGDQKLPVSAMGVATPAMLGHYYGKYGFEALTHAKSVLLAPADVAIEHLFPPHSAEKLKALGEWFVY